MGGATPVYSEKIILEVPADFPLNTTFLSRCLKDGKIHLVSTGHFVPPSRNYRHYKVEFFRFRFCALYSYIILLTEARHKDVFFDFILSSDDSQLINYNCHQILKLTM